jgi:ribosomal protein L37AE/L43A
MAGPPRSVRLPFWSRPAPDERQHAIATLQSLGTTSVPGLAAALSWTIPHTEKVLRELLRHGPSGLVYDVRTGTIRWGSQAAPPTRPSPSTPRPGSSPPWATTASPNPTRSPPVAPPGAPSPATRTGGYRPTVVPPAPTPARPDAPVDHTLRECTRCHTPLVPTGVTDVFACPMCGRRVTGGGSLVSPSPSRAVAPTGPDPKIQQLIAAWATGQPTPCPHCRQPLRHTADGEFRCGSCGARISYGSPSAPAESPSVPGGPVVGPSH